jgi:hypothetical protein
LIFNDKLYSGTIKIGSLIYIFIKYIQNENKDEMFSYRREEKGKGLYWRNLNAHKYIIIESNYFVGSSLIGTKIGAHTNIASLSVESALALQQNADSLY